MTVNTVVIIIVFTVTFFASDITTYPSSSSQVT